MESIRVFDCSKKGDWRFHPSNCFVAVSGYVDSIERHVALSKRILKDGEVCAPTSRQEADSHPVVAFVCGGMLLPPHYLKAFVSLLWHKYLSLNPDLVSALIGYDEFDDGGDYLDISHANVLREYMIPSPTDAFGFLPPTYGVRLKESFEPLVLLLKGHRTIIEEAKLSLFDSPGEIITLFLPHKEALTADMVKKLQRKHKSFVRPIKRYLDGLTPDAVGECRLFESKSQHIAVIHYDRFDTNQLSFAEGLHTLKTLAKERGLAVSVPYDLGETPYTATWNQRYALVDELFSDYYVTLHHVS